MAQGDIGVTVTRRLWVGRLVRSPLEEINYEYFYFFTLAPRQQPGVEFRYSTRNASKNSAESGKRSVLTLCSLYIPYRVRDAA